MGWVMASGCRGRLGRTVTAVAIAGTALVGVTVAVNAASSEAGVPALANDPGCDAFGWRHPMCAGGAWQESASQEWGPASDPTNPFPGAGGQMVPNIDGSLSLPGTPGAI